jgi:hypothetical protein
MVVHSRTSKASPDSPVRALFTISVKKGDWIQSLLRENGNLHNYFCVPVFFHARKAAHELESERQKQFSVFSFQKRAGCFSLKTKD